MGIRGIIERKPQGKVAESPLVTSKWSLLGTNAEKIKYILMSFIQNVGRITT